MIYFRQLFSLAICLTLVSCASKPLKPENLDSLYLDNAFKSAASIESEEQIFHVSPQMKDYIAKKQKAVGGIKNKTKKFVSDLFDPNSIGIEYDHRANLTASEAFDQGAANCMSLTLLSYVMLKEMGFNAIIYDVSLPENWTLDEGVVLANGHVNLKVHTPKSSHIVDALDATVTIDFLPRSQMSILRQRALTLDEFIALYYNNKGADALIKGDKALAYKYFKAATKKAPQMSATWGNLASLYRQSGYVKQAEQVYSYAISIDQNNLTLKENLALLYQLTNRLNQAKKLRQEIEIKRKNNPYYFALQADKQYESGDYESSIANYKKAIRLHAKEPLFLLGIAKVHIKLNQIEQAQVYLERAKEIAPNINDKAKFQSKLAILSRQTKVP